MREQGLICCLCKVPLQPPPARERYCKRCEPRHKVYMSFMSRPEGWFCQFLEADLKTSLRRTFTFKDELKIIDMAKRGGAEFSLAGRQGIEQGISSGRGGVWLNLSREQYRTLC